MSHDTWQIENVSTRPVAATSSHAIRRPETPLAELPRRHQASARTTRNAWRRSDHPGAPPGTRPSPRRRPTRTRCRARRRQTRRPSGTRHPTRDGWSGKVEGLEVAAAPRSGAWDGWASGAGPPPPPRRAPAGPAPSAAMTTTVPDLHQVSPRLRHTALGRAGHLPSAGLAAQLPEELGDLHQPGRRDRVADAEQPARRAARQIAVARSDAVARGLRRLPFVEQHQPLEVVQLLVVERVVRLGDVDLLARLGDAGHVVGHPRRVLHVLRVGRGRGSSSRWCRGSIRRRRPTPACRSGGERPPRSP